jgi:hypothetical protein
VRIWRNDYFWPLALVAIGIFFLLKNLNLLSWLNGNYVWPVVLIVLGAWLIVRRARA